MVIEVFCHDAQRPNQRWPCVSLHNEQGLYGDLEWILNPLALCLRGGTTSLQGLASVTVFDDQNSIRLKPECVSKTPLS